MKKTTEQIAAVAQYLKCARDEYEYLCNIDALILAKIPEFEDHKTLFDFLKFRDISMIGLTKDAQGNIINAA